MPKPKVKDPGCLTEQRSPVYLRLPKRYTLKKLPKELGCGSDSTCWRCLSDEEERGGWEKLLRVLLDLLREAVQIDWKQNSLNSEDSARVDKSGAKW
jgi:hypothetical protein